MSWFDSLPAAETSVPCGPGTHTVRWEAGRLTLPAHPDAEAELVLGALGGDKPGCVTLAETWARHADDLAVLTAGPRCAADRVNVDWAEVTELRERLPTGLTHGTGTILPTGSLGGRFTGAAGSGGLLPAAPQARLHARRLAAIARATGGGGSQPAIAEIMNRQLRQVELLELLALGAEFQFRLAGTVTAAWAGPDLATERTGRRPEFSGVLTGRFALAAQEWLGIDPDAVTVTPHEGPGWGTLEVSGTGRTRRLRSSLPLGWLADVWACGLAVVEGHLTVAVDEPGYPRAQVLALTAPGAEPVLVEVRATGNSPGGLVAWTL